MLKLEQYKLNIKLSSIVFFGIIIQIIATQGILTYNFFKLFGYWELKKVLHPIGILFVIIPVFIKLLFSKNIKLSPESILLFTYLFFQYLYLIIFKKITIVSFFYSFREVILIFLLIASYQLFYLKKEYLHRISKVLLILTIINIIFSVLTQYLGPERYMKLLTGKYYWPIDPELKFKISTFLTGIYRSPAIIGESASVGFFGVFSFFFIFHSKYKKYFWVPIILVLLSFTRSAYLALVIYAILLILNTKKYFNVAIKTLPILIIIFVYAVYSKFLNLESLWMRIDNWFNKINIQSNLFFGGALNKIGVSAPKSSGFAAIIDNYWLYLYYGIGLIGILLVLYFLYKKYNTNKNLLFFTIGIMTSSLFISINQSIPFLVLFPLLSISNWWQNAEE